MSRLVAAVRRLFADPRQSVLGPRPLSVRFCDDIVFASPARRWV